MALDIGRVAYQAYIDELNGWALAEWEKLSKVQQDAWRAAAVAVSQYLNEQRELMEKHPELEG